MLGGSSSINGMIYMRGQARDYDGWATLTGDDAWTLGRVLQDFKRARRQLSRRRRAPRRGRRMACESQRLRWDILDAFAQAAEQAGIPHIDDFNRGDNDGVGYFDVNQRAGCA